MKHKKGELFSGIYWKSAVHIGLQRCKNTQMMNLPQESRQAGKSPSSTQTVFLVWQAEIYCSCLFIYSCIRLTAFLWCCISRLLHIKYLSWVACLTDGVIQTWDLFLELKRGLDRLNFEQNMEILTIFYYFIIFFKYSCWFKI